MASQGKADITISGPNHDLSFKGDDNIRVHRLGHIWLIQDDDQFRMTFNIVTAGFTFNITPVDGKAAFFTSRLPDPKTFDSFNGVFTIVSVAASKLVIDILNKDGKYYFYGFGLKNPQKRRFTRDPIIVNKISDD